MNPERNHNPKDKQGGGRKAATLFCLAAIALTALSLVSIYIFLGPRDRLARYVPADALVYIHGQGRQAVTDIAFDAGFIPQTRASEIALFALELDEGRVWTAALMWSRLAPPTPDEILSLEDAGALKVSPVFYVIRSGEGPIILSEGWNGSLADQDQIADALAAMRSVARIQSYLETDELWENGLDQDIFSANTGPTVLAISGSGDARKVLMSGVSDASSFSRWLGFRLSDAKSTPGVPPLLRTADRRAHMSLTTDRNVIDPFATLFHKAETLRDKAGIPGSYQLDTAKQLILTRFSGRLSLVVWTDGPEPTFAAYLPDSKVHDLIADLNSYLSASFPRKNEIELSDGSTVTEYIVEPGRYSLPKDDTGQTWFAYPIRKHDDGTLVASDQESLERIERAGNTGDVRVCAAGSWPTLDIDNADGVLPWNEMVSRILGLNTPDRLVIQNIGDNFTIFCGY